MINRAFKKISRVTTWVVLFCFAGTNLSWGVPAAGLDIRLPRAEIKIPQELGAVSEEYVNPGTSSILVHIQDAHGHYEAQNQIKNLIAYLEKTYGFSLLLLEGGDGELDPSIYHFFKEPALNLQLGDSLVKEGELSGAEMHLIERMENGGEPVKAFGVESAEVYRQDLQLFKKVHAEDPVSSVFLTGIRERFEILASKVLSVSLRKTVRAWQRFSQSGDLVRYAGFLGAQAEKALSLNLYDARNQKEFPQIIRLLRLKEIEPQINREEVRKEKDGLAVFLRSFKEGIPFAEKLDDFLTGPAVVHGQERKAMPRYFLEELHDVSAPRGFSFKNYPAISRLGQYLILQSEMDSETLFREIEKLSGDLFSVLAKKDEERELIRLMKDLALVDKLFKLELTREDYEQVSGKVENLKPAAIIRRLADIAKEGSFSVPAAFPSIDGLFEQTLEFYRQAEKREGAFLENVISRMTESGSERAVLVTGGFHGRGMAEKFKKRGISFVSVRPRIASLDADGSTNYLSAMLASKKTAFDKAQISKALTVLPKTDFRTRLSVLTGDEGYPAYAARQILDKASKISSDLSAAAVDSRQFITALAQAGQQAPPGLTELVLAASLGSEADFIPVRFALGAEIARDVFVLKAEVFNAMFAVYPPIQQGQPPENVSPEMYQQFMEKLRTLDTATARIIETGMADPEAGRDLLQYVFAKKTGTRAYLLEPKVLGGEPPRRAAAFISNALQFAVDSLDAENKKDVIAKLQPYIFTLSLQYLMEPETLAAFLGQAYPRVIREFAHQEVSPAEAQIAELALREVAGEWQKQYERISRGFWDTYLKPVPAWIGFRLSDQAVILNDIILDMLKKYYPGFQTGQKPYRVSPQDFHHWLSELSERDPNLYATTDKTQAGRLALNLIVADAQSVAALYIGRQGFEGLYAEQRDVFFLKLAWRYSLENLFEDGLLDRLQNLAGNAILQVRAEPDVEVINRKFDAAVRQDAGLQAIVEKLPDIKAAVRRAYREMHENYARANASSLGQEDLKPINPALGVRLATTLFALKTPVLEAAMTLDPGFARMESLFHVSPGIYERFLRVLERHPAPSAAHIARDLRASPSGYEDFAEVFDSRERGAVMYLFDSTLFKLSPGKRKLIFANAAFSFAANSLTDDDERWLAVNLIAKILQPMMTGGGAAEFTDIETLSTTLLDTVRFAGPFLMTPPMTQAIERGLTHMKANWLAELDSIESNYARYVMGPVPAFLGARISPDKVALKHEIYEALPKPFPVELVKDDYFAFLMAIRDSKTPNAAAVYEAMDKTDEGRKILNLLLRQARDAKAELVDENNISGEGASLGQDEAIAPLFGGRISGVLFILKDEVYQAFARAYPPVKQGRLPETITNPFYKTFLRLLEQSQGSAGLKIAAALRRNPDGFKDFERVFKRPADSRLMIITNEKSFFDGPLFYQDLVLARSAVLAAANALEVGWKDWMRRVLPETLQMIWEAFEAGRLDQGNIPGAFDQALKRIAQNPPDAGEAGLNRISQQAFRTIRDTWRPLFETMEAEIRNLYGSAVPDYLGTRLSPEIVMLRHEVLEILQEPEFFPDVLRASGEAHPVGKETYHAFLEKLRARYPALYDEFDKTKEGRRALDRIVRHFKQWAWIYWDEKVIRSLSDEERDVLFLATAGKVALGKAASEAWYPQVKSAVEQAVADHGPERRADAAQMEQGIRRRLEGSSLPPDVLRKALDSISQVRPYAAALKEHYAASLGDSSAESRFLNVLMGGKFEKLEDAWQLETLAPWDIQLAGRNLIHLLGLHGEVMAQFHALVAGGIYIADRPRRKTWETYFNADFGFFVSRKTWESLPDKRELVKIIVRGLVPPSYGKKIAEIPLESLAGDAQSRPAPAYLTAAYRQIAVVIQRISQESGVSAESVLDVVDLLQKTKLTKELLALFVSRLNEFYEEVETAMKKDFHGSGLKRTLEFTDEGIRFESVMSQVRTFAEKWGVIYPINGRRSLKYLSDAFYVEKGMLKRWSELLEMYVNPGKDEILRERFVQANLAQSLRELEVGGQAPKIPAAMMRQMRLEIESILPRDNTDSYFNIKIRRILDEEPAKILEEVRTGFRHWIRKFFHHTRPREAQSEPQLEATVNVFAARLNPLVRDLRPLIKRIPVMDFVPEPEGASLGAVPPVIIEGPDGLAKMLQEQMLRTLLQLYKFDELESLGVREIRVAFGVEERLPVYNPATGVIRLFFKTLPTQPQVYDQLKQDIRKLIQKMRLEVVLEGVMEDKSPEAVEHAMAEVRDIWLSQEWKTAVGNQTHSGIRLADVRKIIVAKTAADQQALAGAAPQGIPAEQALKFSVSEHRTEGDFARSLRQLVVQKPLPYQITEWNPAAAEIFKGAGEGEIISRVMKNISWEDFDPDALSGSRSVILYLKTPVVYRGVTYHAIKLKGVAWKGILQPMLERYRETPAMTMDGSGKIAHEREMNLKGGVPFKVAQNEFRGMQKVFNDGLTLDVALFYGLYTGMFMEGEETGFMASLIPDPKDPRLADILGHYFGELDPRKYSDTETWKNKLSAKGGIPGIRSDLDDYVKRAARRFREAHDKGNFLEFPTPGNVTEHEGLFYLKDFDSWRDIRGANPRQQIGYRIYDIFQFFSHLQDSFAFGGEQEANVLWRIFGVRPVMAFLEGYFGDRLNDPRIFDMLELDDVLRLGRSILTGVPAHQINHPLVGLVSDVVHGQKPQGKNIPTIDLRT